MLIGDPLDEGSNASSTINELWRVENLDAQKVAACSMVRGAMLAQPTGSATSLDLVSTSDVITAIADSL